MRVPGFILFIGVLLFSCNKDKKVTNELEGTWKLEKMQMNDGSYTYPNEIHVFEGKYTDKDTYLRWTKYGADYQDTTVGSYLVTKKGVEVVLRFPNLTVIETDTCTIEDIDKKKAYIRNNLGILFFTKVK